MGRKWWSASSIPGGHDPIEGYLSSLFQSNCIAVDFSQAQNQKYLVAPEECSGVHGNKHAGTGYDRCTALKRWQHARARQVSRITMQDVLEFGSNY